MYPSAHTAIAVVGVEKMFGERQNILTFGIKECTCGIHFSSIRLTLLGVVAFGNAIRHLLLQPTLERHNHLLLSYIFLVEFRIAKFSHKHHLISFIYS